MVSIRVVSTCAALCVVAGAAQAQIASINSFNNNPRNFNDYPSSSLSYSSNFGAGTVDITESNFGTGGAFANRHRTFFSNNGGGTAYGLNNQDYFDVSFDIRVKATNMNLVEGGFYSDTFVGGEPRYIVKANDASFAFDAWLPFVFAGSYGNDVTTRLRMIYNPGSGSGGTQADPSTVTFFRDGTNLGTFNAGNWNSPDNLNGYANGSVFGFYATFSPKTDGAGHALPDAAAEMHISNMVVVPAPGVLGMLGLAGLAVGRRRR